MNESVRKIVNTIGLSVIDVFIITILNVFGFISYNSLGLNEIIFILLLVIFKIVSYALIGQYRLVTSIFGLSDALKLIFISFITGVIGYTILQFIPDISKINIFVSMFIILLEAFLLVSVRCIKRVARIYRRRSSLKTKRTIVVGAGAGAKIVYDECRYNDDMNNKVVAFIDDDSKKIGQLFSGIPIEGPISNIQDIIKKYNASEIIIAIAHLSKNKLREIFELLHDVDVKIKRLPLLSKMGKVNQNRIVDVNIDELLSRDPVKLDNDGLNDFINNKVVLVTGAGGSIGSELVRQIFDYKPNTIVLLDIYENAVYDIQQFLLRKIRREKSDIKLVTLIGATYNEKRMENIFKTYKPDLVFHAAAYKHVPLMEDSPTEAIMSNVIGTYNIAKLCHEYGVEKMVLVSTDKAVRPTNVMGATKRFAEMIIQYFSELSQTTKYSATRFGNVLGSNGSVIPLFKKQIEEGGPVTVTDLEMRRFFMTIPEAVGLILQSAVYAQGGEIFILDMGKPVKIITLAEKMIRQAGYEPYVEIPIEITGLRPGEKIYEELLLDLDNQIKTANEKIFIEKPGEIVPILDEIEFISQVFEIDDAQTVKDLLAKVIVTYHQPERDKVGV